MVHALPLAELEHVSNEFEAIEDFQRHDGVVTSVHLEIYIADILCCIVLTLEIRLINNIYATYSPYMPCLVLG